jgi:predicted acylesterase/phospholipase RssA
MAPKSHPSSEIKYDDIPETSGIRKIKYLTLQGGGMKGLGYVSALEQLESCGVMDQLEAVAGSSAGAIVATLIALG